jgi:hypothetical protein
MVVATLMLTLVAGLAQAKGKPAGKGSPVVTYVFKGKVSSVDEDYVGTGGDNCVDAANPDQADADGDGIGDACDDVDDGTA